MWKYYILGTLCSIITGIFIAAGLFIVNEQLSFIIIEGDPSIWDFIFFLIPSLLSLPGGLLTGFVRNRLDKKTGNSINSPVSIRKIIILGVTLSTVSFFLFGALLFFIFFAFWADAIT